VDASFSEFDLRVREFLATCWSEAQPTTEMPEIHGETDLFEIGVLDSLLVVELLAFVEDVFDVVIDVTRIDDPTSFFTLEGMYRGLVALTA